MEVMRSVPGFPYSFAHRRCTLMQLVQKKRKKERKCIIFQARVLLPVLFRNKEGVF